MVDTEDYFMFKDLARELEQTTGRVNISELSREAGYFLCKPDGTYFVDVTVLFRLLKRMDLTGYGRFFFKRTDLERQCQRALRRAVQKKIIKLTWLIKPRKNEGDLNSYSIFFVSRQKKLELFRNLANAKKKYPEKFLYRIVKPFFTSHPTPSTYSSPWISRSTPD